MKPRLLAVSAILAAAPLFAIPSSAALAACDPATRAIQYLAANQLPDGSLDISSAGFGNPIASENMVIGAAATGYDPNTIQKSGKSVYDYLAAHSSAATNSVGRAATLVLALAAGNTTPGRYNLDDFGGVHPMTVVTSTYHSSGAQTGAYGDGSAFGQALAILAVRAGGQAPPAGAITWLRGIRNTGLAHSSGGYVNELLTDTGWNFGNAANQNQGDTNTTALALQALDAAGDHTSDSSALAFLHTQQNPDGGFTLEKPSAFGTASDADSDALVLEALASTGQPVAAWTVGGNTPLSNLLSLQDHAGGGFSGNSADTVTTSQAPQGLLQVPAPVSAPRAGRAVPAQGCPVAAVAAVSPAPTPRLPAAGAVARTGALPRSALVVVMFLVAGAAVGIRAQRAV